MDQTRKWYNAAILFRAGIIFYMLVTVLGSGLPFWGDHVTLVSHPANYLYVHPGNWILPPSADTGHPPFYPLMLAISWHIGGHNLFISHLFTLLPVLFLLSQAYLLIRRFVPKSTQWIAVLLLLFQPALLALTIAMSSDILLTALFIAGIDGIAGKNERKLYTALLFLPLISLRGWMLVPVLLLLLFFSSGISRRHALGATCMLVPAIAWILFHHSVTGWWLSPPNGNWAHGRALNDGTGFLAKTVEFTVRNLEYGMVFPWIWSIGILVRKKYRKPSFLLRSLMVTLIVSGIFILPFRNPVLVRYLLPLHFLLLLFFTASILPRYAPKTITASGLCILLFFVSCHFWAYPKSASSLIINDWGNGSLAHISVFRLEEEMQDSLRKKGIQVTDIHTAFPEYKDGSDRYLKDGMEAYIPFSPDADPDSCRYFLYSNVMNGLPDSTVEKITHWEKMIHLHAYPVEFALYRNQHPSTRLIP